MVTWALVWAWMPIKLWRFQLGIVLVDAAIFVEASSAALFAAMRGAR